MLLFVYGSLRRDTSGGHHPLLTRARFVASAEVRGRLFRVSWHPGLILDESAGPVVGELFDVGDTTNSWTALDQYEGTEFRRVPVSAFANAAHCQASTYEWLGDPRTATLVISGDWGPPESHRDRGY